MKKTLTIIALIIAGALVCVLSFTAAGRFVWWLFLVGIVLVVLGGGAAYLETRRSGEKKEPLINAEYAPKNMMTVPELHFYRALCAAMNGEYEIVPQAAMITFVDKRTRSAYRNELFRVVDFVVAELGTFRPLVAVELNDASHARADRKLRDEKVAAILRSAHIPLLVVTPGSGYDVRELRRQILKLI